MKLLTTVLAAVAIGATAAAMHAAIGALVGWRNTTLQRFYARSLLQVGVRALAFTWNAPLDATSIQLWQSQEQNLC